MYRTAIRIILVLIAIGSGFRTVWYW